MRMVRVREVVRETSLVMSLYLDMDGGVEPGQFVTLWVPRGEEVPMSLSYISPKVKGVTVRVVGNGTRALAAQRTGAWLGVKGPSGHGYVLKGDRVLGVAGGTGIASLAPALEMAVKQGREAFLVLGAKDANEIFFDARMIRKRVNVSVITEDGSMGVQGLATDLLPPMLGSGKIDLVLACGPEPMLYKVARMCEEVGVESQCSLERYMKCGVGLCGSCALGRYRVCSDGPVFSGASLLRLPEFGCAKRSPAGALIPL